MSTTTRKDLVDRLLGGTLDALLLDALHGERSFFSISADLISQHNVSVPPETLRRWAVALDSPSGAAS